MRTGREATPGVFHFLVIIWFLFILFDTLILVYFVAAAAVGGRGVATAFFVHFLFIFFAPGAGAMGYELFFSGCVEYESYLASEILGVTLHGRGRGELRGRSQLGKENIGRAAQAHT